MTPEQMRKLSYSLTRIKVIHRGETSRDVSPKFKRRSSEAQGLRTLETMATAAGDWIQIKKQLNHGRGTKFIRNFTDRNPFFAFTLRNDLNQGTLRFGVEG